jgi:hypothetical protein
MHTTVRFLVRDIVHPRPVEVLYELYEKDCLQGEVLALTDDGQEPEAFMVVQVRGLREPVIVPAGKVGALPGRFERSVGGVGTWAETPGAG